MGAADCEAFVKNFVGEKLTDDELEKAFEKYDELRRRLVAEGKTDNIDKRIANAIAHELVQKKYSKAKSRMTMIKNVTVKREMNDFIRQMQDKGYGPAQSILIKMEGGQSNEPGVRDSVDNKKNALAQRWIGSMLAEVQSVNPAILSIIRKDPKFDEQFAEELGELLEGGTPGKTGNKDAQDFARIVKRWSETARLEYNNKGGMKQAPDGHTDASHDAYKMIEAGKEQWVNDVFNMLDRERTFQGIDPNNVDEIKQILRKDYDRKTTGRYFGKDVVAPTLEKAPTSLIDRFSIDGNFYFKDFEAKKQYQYKYGHGTFISSVIHQMTQMARATAAMDVFGPTPEIMIKQLSTEHVERLGNEMTNITDTKQLNKYRKWIRDLQVSRLSGAVDEMTGTASIPVNASVAKVATGIRSILSMAKMSNLVITSTIGDSMNMMGNNVYGGQKGLNALAPILRMFDGMDKNTRKNVAYRLGEGFQGFIGSVYADAIETGPMHGGLAQMMNTYFKWIGVTGMFDHSRQAFVRERAVWLGSQRGKTFDQLDPFLKNGLQRQGINSLMWDAIRSADLELANGEHYLMPEAARDAEEKYVLLLASTKIKEAFHLSKVDEAKLQETKEKRLAAFEKRREQIIDETRYDIEMKLRQYYGDETNYAVVQPNAKSRRISHGAIAGAQGTRPGSAIGEVVRSMFMYKSFSLVNWDNLARAFENRNFLKMGSAGAGVLVRLLAFQFVGGVIIEYMKDIAKGNWPPKVPWDPEMVSRAMATGGTMGMFGDYLTGLVNGYDTPAAILGPQLDFLVKSGKFVVHDLPLNKKGRAREALDLVLNTTPFGNLMIAKPTLDTLFFDEIREWSSPGYKRRKRRKLKEKGQYNLYQEMLR